MAKPQVDASHSPSSPWSPTITAVRAAKKTAKGTTGWALASKAAMAVAAPTAHALQVARSSQRTNTARRPAPASAVSHHLAAKMAAQRPPSAGAQLAKTRIATSRAKKVDLPGQGEPRLRDRQRGVGGGPLALLVAVDPRHREADEDAEDHGAHRPRDAELEPEDPRGQDDRQDVDRRARVEEGRRRSESGARACRCRRTAAAPCTSRPRERCRRPTPRRRPEAVAPRAPGSAARRPG